MWEYDLEPISYQKKPTRRPGYKQRQAQGEGFQKSSDI